MNPRSEVKLSCYGCSQEILTHETNTIKKNKTIVRQNMRNECVTYLVL